MDKNEVIQSVSDETIKEYLESTGLDKQLFPKEKVQFINMVKDYGLNPFKREIYCNIYGEGKYRKCSIVTGYEVYLKRAERIGKLDGWNCQVEGNIKDRTLAATVTIYRKDWSHPFVHTSYYAECVQCKNDGHPNSIWAKMPIFMTKKVAIAQAFRLCFSDEFGGMPYTNDELGVDIAKVDIPSEKVSSASSSTETVSKVSDRDKLQKILEKYKDKMDEKPLQLCESALSNGDETVITEMLNRSMSYFERKGVKIEI